MRLRPRYIRDRLTLWYALVFTLVLLAYIGGAALLQFWQLSNSLYHAEVQDVETAEGLLYFKPDGALAMHEEYYNHPTDRLLLDRLMEVLSPEGQVLFRNEKLGNRSLDGPPFAGEGQTGYSERSVRMQDGTRALIISHVHSIDSKPVLIRLGYSTGPIERRLAGFVGILLLALPIALIVSGFAGYRMAGKVLDPLKQMAQRTEQITAHRLNDRIPVENADDELGHMARVLNGLLQRIEESFEQLKRFTSDVSHELRTPLASMRSVGEVGLHVDHAPEAYRETIGSMLEEVGRLTRMIDTLFTISRADSGQIKLQKATFPLMDLVRETVALAGVLAEEKKQKLTVRGTESILVHADRTLLRQAVLNLLDNAVKYSPASSEIQIHLDDQDIASSRAGLTIEDEGPGIPEEARARVFDRFYRVDEARSREPGGAGLGLSIAKWVVEAHGGEIGLQPSRTGGCAFRISLPTSTQAG